MPLIVIDATGLKAQAAGVLSRRLVEIRSGLWIGRLSKRTIEQTWTMVRDAEPKAAILVYPAKNELGFAIESFGTHRYAVSDNFGIPLITLKKGSKKSGAKDDQPQAIESK